MTFSLQPPLQCTKFFGLESLDTIDDGVQYNGRRSQFHSSRNSSISHLPRQALRTSPQGVFVGLDGKRRSCDKDACTKTVVSSGGGVSSQSQWRHARSESNGGVFRRVDNHAGSQVSNAERFGDMVASWKEEDPLVTPDVPRESSVGEFCCNVPIGRVTRGVDGDDCGRRRLVSDGELVLARNQSLSGTNHCQVVQLYGNGCVLLHKCLCWQHIKGTSIEF